MMSTPNPAWRQISTPPGNRALNTPDDTRILIDANAAAERASISVRFLAKLTSEGAVPSRLIGRRRLYSVAELSAWVDLGCPTEPGSADRVSAHVLSLRGGGR